MSGQALIWAANVRGLAPATKIVLIQLAERHNKDTGRCDPKIQRLAEDCEMSRASLMRHLATLEDVGFITRVSQGLENGGRASNQYDLHMSETIRDGQRSQIETGGKGLNSDGQRSQTEGAKVSTVRPPYSIEPVLNLKEPDAHPRDDDLFPAKDLPTKKKADEPFERFWKVYPKKVGKPGAQRNFDRALRSGADPAEIIAGAERYATAMAGKDPGFVKHPQGWLSDQRWLDQPEEDLPSALRTGGHRLRQNWGEIVR